MLKFTCDGLHHIVYHLKSSTQSVPAVWVSFLYCELRKIEILLMRFNNLQLNPLLYISP